MALQIAGNTFTQGMTTDINDLNMSSDTMTTALNATLSTYNGNEGVLLNDMGNCKIINDYSHGKEIAHFPKGYIPIGSVEFGGIIYYTLVSLDYITDSNENLLRKCQIGSFPSPDYANKSGKLIWQYQPLKVGYTLITPNRKDVKLLLFEGNEIDVHRGSVGEVKYDKLELQNKATYKKSGKSKIALKTSDRFFRYTSSVLNKNLYITSYPIGSPASGVYGTLYTFLEARNLQCINTDGVSQWRLPKEEEIKAFFGLTFEHLYTYESDRKGMRCWDGEGEFFYIPYGGFQLVDTSTTNLGSFTENLQGNTTENKNTIYTTLNTNTGSGLTRVASPVLKDDLSGNGLEGGENPEEELEEPIPQDLNINVTVEGTTSTSSATVNSPSLEGGVGNSFGYSLSNSNSVYINIGNWTDSFVGQNCYIWGEGGYMYRISDGKKLTSKYEPEGDFSQFGPIKINDSEEINTYYEKYVTSVSKNVPLIIIESFIDGKGKTTKENSSSDSSLTLKYKIKILLKDGTFKYIEESTGKNKEYDDLATAEQVKNLLIQEYEKNPDNFNYKTISTTETVEYKVPKYKALVFLVMDYESTEEDEEDEESGNELEGGKEDSENDNNSNIPCKIPTSFSGSCRGSCGSSGKQITATLSDPKIALFDNGTTCYVGPAGNLNIIAVSTGICILTIQQDGEEYSLEISVTKESELSNVIVRNYDPGIYYFIPNCGIDNCTWVIEDFIDYKVLGNEDIGEGKALKLQITKNGTITILFTSNVDLSIVTCKELVYKAGKQISYIQDSIWSRGINYKLSTEDSLNNFVTKDYYASIDMVSWFNEDGSIYYLGFEDPENNITIDWMLNEICNNISSFKYDEILGLYYLIYPKEDSSPIQLTSSEIQSLNTKYTSNSNINKYYKFQLFPSKNNLTSTKLITIGSHLLMDWDFNGTHGKLRIESWWECKKEASYIEDITMFKNYNVVTNINMQTTWRGESLNYIADSSINNYWIVAKNNKLFIRTNSIISSAHSELSYELTCSGDSSLIPKVVAGAANSNTALYFTSFTYDFKDKYSLIPEGTEFTFTILSNDKVYFKFTFEK